MKRILLILLVVVCSCVAYAQSTIENYIGTWKYEKGDTVFIVKLIEGETYNKKKQRKVLDFRYLFGGYSLSVRGKIIENYIDNIHEQWIIGDEIGKDSEQHIYIRGAYFPDRKSNGFTFYDQRMRHFDGNGIIAGSFEFIAPNKLHWTLNEKKGIWNATEGLEDWVEVKPIGFSVPTDVIMTKVDE